MERYRANVYFDPEVRRRAKELADRMGLSFSAFVNMAVFEYLKQCSVMELSDIFKRVLDREIMTIKRSEERERSD